MSVLTNNVEGFTTPRGFTRGTYTLFFNSFREQAQNSWGTLGGWGTVWYKCGVMKDIVRVGTSTSMDV